MIKAQIPKKLEYLFRSHRYKVARGGRGSAKSWSFARALLIIGAKKPLRVLCTREVQMSIKQSVHKLLSDQIQLLGLESIYTVQYDKIIGANGTEFTFSGLSSLTADTIKSFEGYDVCWVEEGQAISKRSWDILIPTIRKEGSEIWVSYNPDLESDETHQRFSINPPPDCINVEINWRDNPWFSEVLDRERLHCKETDPDSYDHIWEGKCRSAVEGAIYFKQIQDAEANRRICNIPNDPMLKTHIVLDLGWEDSLAVGLVQKHLSEIRIVEYLEAYQTTIPTLFREIETRGYNWGKVFLPHDGFAKTLSANGNSTADIIKALGWQVQPKEETVISTIEEGIRQTRLAFHQIYFDIERTAADQRPEESKIPGFHHTNYSNRLVEVLKRYQRKVSRQTGSVGSPVHNEFSHGADMLRYLVLNKDHMLNETAGINKDMLSQRRRKKVGWMAA